MAVTGYKNINKLHSIVATVTMVNQTLALGDSIMYKYTMLSTTYLAAIIAATNSQALELGKPITTSVVITQPGKEAGTTKKQVVLMNLKLTPQEHQAFFNATKKTTSLKSTGEFIFLLL